MSVSSAARSLKDPLKVLYAGSTPYSILHSDSNARNLIVLSHATGFCKEVWIPVVKKLRNILSPTQRVRILAVDLGGHGDHLGNSDVERVNLRDWGKDLKAVVDADAISHGKSKQDIMTRFGVGHSAGSTAMLACEWDNPGYFNGGLMLIEPILRHPPFDNLPHNPLCDATLKRRRYFRNPSEAFANWKGKGAFKFWDDEALRYFSIYGIRQRRDKKQGYELKCRPEFESKCYMALNEMIYSLDSITTPISFFIGENTDFKFKSRKTGKWIGWDNVIHKGRYVVIPDSTHFVVSCVEVFQFHYFASIITHVSRSWKSQL
mmetsp:Transcript_6146/g.8053  ORF Transcript_6146/g.8053 Transcript_6146/m.8053 type:complete len:319 (+) Transcript_6146:2806-3762(+)